MLQVLEKTEHKIPTRVADVTFEVVGVMQSERQRKLRMALDGGGTAHTSLDAMQAAEQEHMLNDGGSHAIHGLLKPTLEVLLAVRTAAARAGGAGYTCPLPGIALPG